MNCVTKFNIWFDLLRVEFVDIKSITQKFRGKIEEMKKNFARVNDRFQIGIDGADGKWGYTPTDKYKHVIYLFGFFWYFYIFFYLGFILHLSVLPLGFPVWKVPNNWCWHTICLQHQPPLWWIREIWREQAVCFCQGYVSIIQNSGLWLQV